MAISPRDALTVLLKNAGTNSSASAAVKLRADTLELHVAGVGEVALPVLSAQAKHLITQARPAYFGKGEETLHDASVRDTWEITPDQVTLSGATWDTEFATALKQLGDRLGLPSHATLRAELHSMLIYGKGQFFAAHQDSEKHDDMVATLVMSLPSTHSGGELVIDDGGVQKQYSGSRQDLELVAFYADRRHEVLPVRSGHRTTLTFNLLVDRAADQVSVPQLLIQQTSELLQQHFTTPSERYYRRSGDAPERLVILLDHEYSQHGLVAGQLKGVDAQRVSLLTSAAAKAQCEIALAQADIEETWAVMPSDDYRYFDYDDEDDYEDVDDGELSELVDGVTVLTWWTDAQSPGKIQLALPDDEICAVTPSVSLEPYESEYEGYMGNYGNTVDRWYHRAALVLWPADAGFAVRAQAAPEWALESIQQWLDAGDLERAQHHAAMLPASYRPPQHALPQVMKIAAGLHQPDASMHLLQSYTMEQLTASDAPTLAALSKTYPPSFWNELFNQWKLIRYSAPDHRIDWIERTLKTLCQELRSAGAANFADRIITFIRNWLFKTVTSVLNNPHREQRERDLDHLGPTTAALLLSANDYQAENVVAELETFGPAALPLLVSTLRSNPPPAPPAFTRLANITKEQLNAFLATPQRADNDWSIDWLSPGGNDDLDRFATFLKLSDQRLLEWPLAAPRRQAIHMVIEREGLPVEHTTRRQGRPYVLVLEKTKALFTRESQARKRAAADLEWITRKFK